MSAHRASASESGFVLVGVVVFVLALTILALSLYGLSSYEAQFLQRSLDEEQAFQSAVGGVERAKFVLTSPLPLPLPSYVLENVRRSLPLENVISAVAIQPKGGMEDSTGLIQWNLAQPIRIRVTAEVNGARRTIEGDFTPKDSVALSYYSSLITVSEGIEVVTESDNHYAENRNHAVLLGGPIWESSGHDPHHWLDYLKEPAPFDIRNSPQVPVPDVVPFLTTARINAALPAVNSEPPNANPIYTLDASGTPGGGPAYFRAEDEGTGSRFSLDSDPHTACTIQVRGLAVWLLPHGAFFNQSTVITGDLGTDCLVIIAGLNTSDASIWFRGYLQADIPVILISSGKVRLWHENNYTESTFTNDLAIFARSAEFMGPDPDQGVLQLSRDPNGRLNKPLGVNPCFLEALAREGALPNATWGGRRLDLVPGTWQASDR
jgi:hypothetical protein